MHQPPPEAEIFDVVDASDRVVGQETRANVHAQGLLHRAVHLLLFNRKGEVFLQRRSMTKDLHPGRLGTSAAGHVDSGEDYDTALLREVGEELGITLETLPERLFKLDACRETGEEFLWIYRLQWDEPLHPHPTETDGGEWYPARELQTRMQREPEVFAPSACYVWDAYCKWQAAQ